MLNQNDFITNMKQNYNNSLPISGMFSSTQCDVPLFFFLNTYHNSAVCWCMRQGKGVKVSNELHVFLLKYFSTWLTVTAQIIRSCFYLGFLNKSELKMFLYDCKPIKRQCVEILSRLILRPNQNKSASQRQCLRQMSVLGPISSVIMICKLGQSKPVMISAFHSETFNL